MARPPIKLLEEFGDKPGTKAVAWAVYSFVSYLERGEWIVWPPMAVVAKRAAMDVRALRGQISTISDSPNEWIQRVNRKDYHGRMRSVLLLAKGDPEDEGEIEEPDPGEPMPPDRHRSAAHPEKASRSTGEGMPPPPGTDASITRHIFVVDPADLCPRNWFN